MPKKRTKPIAKKAAARGVAAGKSATKGLPKRTAKSAYSEGTITREQAREAVRAVIAELKEQGVELTPAFEDE